MQATTEALRQRGVDGCIALGWALALGTAVHVLLGRGLELGWDNGAHNLPLTYEAYRQWRELTLPAWNPFLWSGAPLLADPQSLTFYPPMFLAFWLCEDSPIGAMRLAIAGHIGWTAAGTYLLTRSIGASRAGGLVGATIFTLNPLVLERAIGTINMFLTLSWLPWLVLLVAYGLRAQSPRSWLALGALAACLAWFAGYPQWWLYSAGAAQILALGLPAPKHSWRRIWFVPAAVALGLGLVAFQLLPMLELITGSNRAVSMEAAYGLPIDLLGWLLTPHPVTILGPGQYNAVHIGLLSTSLALVASVRPTRFRLTALALTALGLWLAMGRRAWLTGLLQSLPVLELLRIPSKYLIWTNLGIAVLASLGVTDLQRGAKRWQIATLLGVAGLAVAMVSLGPPPPWGEGPSRLARVGSLATAVTANVLLAAAAALGLSRRSAAAAGWIGTTALAGTFLTFAHLHWWYTQTDLRSPARYATAPSHQERARPRPTRLDADWAPGDGWRTHWAYGMDSDRPMEGHLGMALGAFWRIEMTSGYSALLERFYEDALSYGANGFPRGRAMSFLGDERSATLDVLAARYVLLRPERAAELVADDEGRFAWTQHDEATGLLINRDALPRVRFVERVRRVESREESFRLANRKRERLASLAIVDAETPVENDLETSSRSPCDHRAHSRRPGAIDVAVSCSEPGFAVFSERWVPGWRAEIDGRPAAVYRVYGLVLGIDVPAGAGSIALRYDPPGFRTGLWISGLSALGLLWMVAVGRTHQPAGATDLLGTTE